jgi:16S rRNA (cytosine967-C5)-methyltransferase
MADSREISLQILQNVLDGKNFVVSSVNDKHKESDGAFVTMLVLTALRHLVYVRKVLKNLMTKKLSQQNPVAQNALILGATELLYMQTPDYAVINSYVNLVKAKTDKYVGGFVNAVLRKIAGNKESLTSEDKGEFFPQSFRTLLRQSYSSKVVDAVEKTALLEPALDISCTSEESAEKLGGTVLPLGTIRLESKGKIGLLPDYDKGTWWVQDFSSALAVKMLDDLEEKKVLDLCAAPGGKTAQLLSRGAKVTCVDVSAERLKTLEENLQRLNLKPEKIVCDDGLNFLQKTAEKFDVVLLDAPCSATGTLRRHPEVVHLKKADDVEKQKQIQKQFLDNIDNVLLPDGVLVYCTCSLCKDEGEAQIRAFLQKNPGYKTVDLHSKIPLEIAPVVTEEGWLRVLPQHLVKFGGADGFFVACLRKAV